VKRIRRGAEFGETRVDGAAPLGPDEPDPTRQDLKQLGFAVFLFEFVILGLALGTRAFFGTQTALWVGLGLGAFILAAFALITAASLLVAGVAGVLARRASSQRKDRAPGR
jgi:hypothetical protein